MPLGMRVKVTAGTGSNPFSTPRTAKNGLYSHFESEAWLSDPDSNIPLQQSSDIFRVYLDATIARRISDHLAKLVLRNDQQEIRGSACSSSVNASTWYSHLDHPNPVVLEASKKKNETGVKYSGAEEKCEVCLLNKSRQQPHPSKRRAQRDLSPRARLHRLDRVYLSEIVGWLSVYPQFFGQVQ